jgi:hypothetical protein
MKAMELSLMGLGKPLGFTEKQIRTRQPQPQAPQKNGKQALQRRQTRVLPRFCMVFSF